MSNKVVIIVGSVVAAALVAVAIVVVILISTINAQAEEARYKACMSAAGYAGDAPGMATDDELDAYIDGIVDTAEFCSR